MGHYVPLLHLGIFISPLKQISLTASEGYKRNVCKALKRKKLFAYQHIVMIFKFPSKDLCLLLSKKF